MKGLVSKKKNVAVFLGKKRGINLVHKRSNYHREKTITTLAFLAFAPKPESLETPSFVIFLTVNLFNAHFLNTYTPPQYNQRYAYL